MLYFPLKPVFSLIIVTLAPGHCQHEFVEGRLLSNHTCFYKLSLATFNLPVLSK
jgi:hypothetical protein